MPRCPCFMISFNFAFNFRTPFLYFVSFPGNYINIELFSFVSSYSYVSYKKTYTYSSTTISLEFQTFRKNFTKFSYFPLII